MNVERRLQAGFAQRSWERSTNARIEVDELERLPSGQ
jgi:hypothetical protein